ncbi:cupin-like domain-containing protein [Thermoactinomyces mirandus]|uniref:Cupin-like domain-containing protein n=1 Tax=Thermoactinomyces mirandus TaxID=2756294 RepID=A0A7W2AQ32_9BACL|nr:cupin-like domain-containing protein [Thermoactinomyces mirandus]MBA4600862.1 cupin-like domain-containing protein [Thermoactinomyces mirandus]
MDSFEIPPDKMIDKRFNLSVEEFDNEYGKPGKPVLLTGIMEKWPASQKWTLEFFKTFFNEHTVIVKRSSKRDEQYEVSLGEYVDYLLKPEKEEDPLYLADWNFSLDFPELLNDYKVPDLFGNWLHYVPRVVMPPLRWIYIGPARSGTGLHMDVAMTGAWNAILSGRKRWAFFSPDQTGYMYNGAVNAFAPDYEKYPLFKNAKPIYAIQKPGEIIFTPSGWWHQVINEEDCVSITENFVNHTNFKRAIFPYLSTVCKYQKDLLLYYLRQIRGKIFKRNDNEV